MAVSLSIRLVLVFVQRIAHPRLKRRPRPAVHSIVSTSSPLISPASGPVFCVMVTVYRPGLAFGSRHENPQLPPQPYSMSVEATVLPSGSRIVTCGFTLVKSLFPAFFWANGA